MPNNWSIKSNANAQTVKDQRVKHGRQLQIAQVQYTERLEVTVV